MIARQRLILIPIGAARIGIFRCPGGVYGPSYWSNSNGRLCGFPWGRLQVLKLQLNQ